MYRETPVSFAREDTGFLTLHLFFEKAALHILSVLLDVGVNFDGNVSWNMNS